LDPGPIAQPWRRKSAVMLLNFHNVGSFHDLSK
jgi:hypothetical protein